MKRSVVGIGIAAMMVLSGCVTMSYEELERVDQAAAGNQGYLVGEAPPLDVAARPTSRTVTRVDIEMMPPKEAWRRWRGQTTETAPASSTTAPLPSAGAKPAGQP